MPRPNKPRQIGGETSLAERVAFERDQRGWSYEGLAGRMEKAGCAINASAIYKIEKGTPPRRITVDELVAFGKVFEIPLDELLMPASIVKERKLHKGLDELTGKFFSVRRAMQDFDQSLQGVQALASGLGFELLAPVETARDIDDQTVWVVDIGTS